jgi:uncharacterized protein
MGRVTRWIRRRPWSTLSVVVVAGFAALNFAAYRHAYRMLHYVNGGGARTATPQALSAGEKLAVLVLGVEVPRPANTQSPSDFQLASETVRFAAADGVNLEAWLIPAAGAKGTVLLFPGYPAARAALLPEAVAFHELGWSTLLVDFRGCGGSDGSETTIGYREGEDVAAALRWARARGLPGPHILYGQSMGSAAVLRSVAACAADPDGLIIESAFNRLLDTVSNRFEIMRVPAFPAARLLVFWGGVQTGFSGFEHNPEEYARACRMPALALHGAADAYAKPAEGRAVFDNLAGRKEWIAFPDAPHVALHGVDARRWRDGVARFLNSIVR